MRNIILSLLISLCSFTLSQAQFRALRSLPWYPKAEQGQAYNTQSDASVGVLEELNNAFNEGNYRDVVFTYYPRAISSGYQRNSSLYNNTRRALRQLMHENPSNDLWKQMQQLYKDRISCLGSEDYDYRNNLETTSWSEEQLQNERIAALASINNRYQECYRIALDRVQKASGRIDLAVILQGMFGPLNRAHVANNELGASLNDRYQEILGLIDKSERFMEQEHREDFLAYYPSDIIDQVRAECMRVISVNKANDRAAAREEQERSSAAYNEALAFYHQKDYAQAYNACNSGWVKYQTPEFRILKSTILQNRASAATSTADRVAYLCAAYEAGAGYVSRQTLNRILSGLQSNLFMSGMAGKRHHTQGSPAINQQIWTMEELNGKTQN